MMKRHFVKSIYVTAVAIIALFLYRAFLSKILEKKVLADFFTALDLLTFVAMIFIGFRSAMVVSYAKDGNDKEILNIFRLLLALFSAVFLAFLGDVVTAMRLSTPPLYIAAMFVSLMLYTYLSNQLSMYKMYAQMNITSFLEPVFLLGGFGICYFWLGLGDYNSLTAAFVIQCVAVSLYIVLIKQKSVKEPKLFFVKLSNESLHFVKNALISSGEFALGMLSVYITVFIFSRYFGTEVLGDFQVVAKTVFWYLIAVFVFPIFKFVLPEVSSFATHKSVAEIESLSKWIYRYALLVWAISFTATALLGKLFIQLFFTEQYLKAYWMLLPLIASTYFVIVNAYYVAVVRAFDRFLLSLSIRVFGLVAFVGFSVAAVALKEPLIAIYGMAFSYGAMFTLSWYYYRKLVAQL